MKTSLLDAWKKRASSLSVAEEPKYPVADLRHHYVYAVALYTLNEKAALEDELNDERYSRNHGSPNPNWDDYPVSMRGLDFKTFADFSTETFGMLNSCRREGLYEFLLDQSLNPNEMTVRNVCQFIMRQKEVQSDFRAASTAVRALVEAYDFDGDADFA